MGVYTNVVVYGSGLVGNEMQPTHSDNIQDSIAIHSSRGGAVCIINRVDSGHTIIQTFKVDGSVIGAEIPGQSSLDSNESDGDHDDGYQSNASDH